MIKNLEYKIAKKILDIKCRQANLKLSKPDEYKLDIDNYQEQIELLLNLLKEE